MANNSNIRISGATSPAPDYTTLSAWIAATANDLTITTGETATLYDDWVSGLNDPSNLTGATTNSSNFRTITVIAGGRHTGIPQTGFYMSGDTGSNATPMLDVNENYYVLEWLDIENTRTTGLNTNAAQCNGQNGTVTACIFTSASASADAVTCDGSSATSSTWPVLLACLFYSGGNNGLGSQDTTRTRYTAKNCTSVNSGNYGFLSGATNASIITDCVAYGSTTGDYSANQDTTNGNYNASGDTSANVFTNYVTGIVSGDFNATGSNDFHLSGTGSSLYHAGSTTGAASTDIDGESFDASTPSIGMDEYIAAGGAAVGGGLLNSVLLQQMRLTG